MQFFEGAILAIHKPSGPSSFAVVARLRKITGIQRIGHAGTLDPLASGVLVVGIGRSATKQLAAAVAAEKEYQVAIRLGATSTTDDAEGVITETQSPPRPPTRDEIEIVLSKFAGKIQQVPPQFSAIKVGGRRAYQQARQGRAVDLDPRTVEIRKIKVLEYAYPSLRLRVVTGKGAYIRSLARDIGQAIGVGGYVTELVRTRVGDWRLENSIQLEKIGQSDFSGRAGMGYT